MKNRNINIAFISLFFLMCSYNFAQTIDGNNIREDWEEEWARIVEQADNYQEEQQAKILTLADLECTYWIPVDNDRFDDMYTTVKMIH